MCGRVIQNLPLNRLIEIARAVTVHGEANHQATFNGCPTNYLPAIRSTLTSESADQEQELSFLRWGLPTSYNMVINARTEEMFMKPLFKKLIKNRCVLLVSGYYQWDKGKQPHAFTPSDNDHFCMAGLYTDQGECVILTKEAVPPLSSVHQRMPVILTDQEVRMWLDPKFNHEITSIVEKCFLAKQKAIWKQVKLVKVAPYVNSIKEKSEKCLMSLQEYKQEQHKKGLGKYFKAKQKQIPKKQSSNIKAQQPSKTPKQSTKQSTKQEHKDKSQIPQAHPQPHPQQQHPQQQQPQQQHPQPSLI